jgi:hypothetical protein
METSSNLFRVLLLAPLFVHPCWSQPRLQWEAGASRFALTSSTFPHPTPVSGTIKEDDAVWAPFVAADYSISQRLGLRLSYHYIDSVTYAIEHPVEPQPSAWFISTRYTDDLHLLTLAPELKWALGNKTTISVAPQLNWIHVKQVFGTFTNAPHVSVLPPVKRTKEAFTFGASAGVTWQLGRRWGLALRYSYLDLDPSWGRRSHVISGGVRLML